MKKLFYTLHPCEVQIGLMAITAKNSICLAGLRSSLKMKWLRSGCALLIHFNNFAIPSVLLVAIEGVILIYF